MKRAIVALIAIVMMAIGVAGPTGAETAVNRPGGGQWSVSSDGRVNTVGAPHYGDAYTQRVPDGRLLAEALWEPMIGIAPTQSGNGYWLAARDSGVFAFGDAAFQGNLISQLIARDNLPAGTLTGDNILDYLHGEVVDIASTGDGYYLLGRDGGVFTFGHLAFHGSMSGQLGTDAVDLRVAAGGYVIVGANQGEWICRGGACSQTKAPSTVMIARVVDGDTVEISGGQRVRLIGIDAPETGQCGSAEATTHLRGLVEGRAVTLTAGARDDTDRYGRLLRYIDVNGTDAGLALIHGDFAIARYDSRDGYGHHTREASYVAADNGVIDRCQNPPPPPPPPSGGGSCDPNYTPCIPPFPPDLDCGDIGHPVTVIGTDPHGLDGDGDGRGCESYG